MACVCVKDRYDVYARYVHGECTPEAIKRTALMLVDDSLQLDEGELVEVGIAATNDPGLARISDGMDYGDGGIEWLYHDVGVKEWRK